jgi:hypothetical protein
MHRLFYILMTLLASIAFAPEDAQAQEWNFTVTPYLWAPSLDTSLDIGSNPPVDGSGSVLDFIDGAFLIAGEARRGPWSILGELNYLSLSDEFGTARTGTVGQWNVKGTMGSLGAAYAFYDRQGVRIEGLAGLRGWDIDATTTVLGAQASASESWVDPIVGLRFEAPLAEKVNIAGMANIGGFGVGSDLQWEAMAQVEWSVSDLVTLSGGYRHLYLDFNDGGTAMEYTMSGPFVAVRFAF